MISEVRVGFFGGKTESVSMQLKNSIATNWETICLATFDRIYTLVDCYIQSVISEEFNMFYIPLQNFMAYLLNLRA